MGSTQSTWVYLVVVEEKLKLILHASGYKSQ